MGGQAGRRRHTGLPGTKPINDLLLRALRLESLRRPPVWFMRQAGRYLPEYRRTRARAGNILKLFKDPESACQVALQPLERYPLDAAILFSDILTIPDAMGLGLHFLPDEGPRFERPIRSTRDVSALRVPEPETDLHYVIESVRLTRAELGGRVPLIGFSGSPWTLATYMVEAGSSRSFSRVLAMKREAPGLLLKLLELLALSVGSYLSAQLRAGAQVVQIFDTWGGILPEDDYAEFSLRWINMALAADGLSEAPAIVYCKDGGRCLSQTVESGIAAVGVDHHCDLAEIAQSLGGRVAVQGNLDPGLLSKDARSACAATRRVLDEWGGRAGHIFNVGHGIPPDADPEVVAAVVETCRAHEATP